MDEPFSGHSRASSLCRTVPVNCSPAKMTPPKIVSHTTGINTMRKFVSIIRFRSEISRIFSKTIPPPSSICFHYILYSTFFKYF